MDLSAIGNRPVYIMPFGANGAVTCKILKDKGYNVLGFCDNKPAIKGKLFYGLEIQTPQAAYDAKNEDAVVVICSYRFGDVMQKQLKKIGFDHIVLFEDIFCRDDIDMIMDYAKNVSIDEIHSVAPLYVSAIHSLKYELKCSLIPNELKAGDDLFVINNLDCVITERCSLKCEGCAALIQYYTNPNDIKVTDVIEGMSKLAGAVDFIRNVMVIGGEPFMAKGLVEILSSISKIKNIGVITIITNGTIVPDDSVCKSIRDNDVFVKISNYGECSKNLSGLTRKLDIFNISYAVMDELPWYENCKIVSYTDRTEEEIQQAYNNCEAICTAVIGTKYAKCEFAVHAERLKALPHGEPSTIDVTEDDLSKDKIKEYLNNNKHLNACRVCCGTEFMKKPIERAKQIKEPLPYLKYE